MALSKCLVPGFSSSHVSYLNLFGSIVDLLILLYRRTNNILVLLFYVDDIIVTDSSIALLTGISIL